MALQRDYQVKVYSNDNVTFLGSINLSKEKAPPVFRSKIGGGQGECVIDLNLPFDDFGEGTTIKFMNFVELWVTDSANPLGRRIYKGYISRYEPYIDPNGEGVKVTCLGIASLLTRSYYGSTPVYSVTQTATDPETIAKAIIDNFNSAYSGSLISYAGTTTAVGSNVSKVFNQRKWSDALNDTVDLATTGYWWHIDQNGYFYFQPKPSTVTHTFTIGRDVDSLHAPKDAESIVNDVAATWQSGSVTATDPTSQATYGTGSPATGRMTKLVSDTTITSVGGANNLAAKEVADNKDAIVSCRIVVNTNYDLESIRPGQTCRIVNFKLASTFFGTNALQIVTMSYNGDTVELELGETHANFGIQLAKFVNG